MAIEEDDSEQLEEDTKYKLKLDTPKSEPAFGGSDDSGFGGDDFGDEGGDDFGGDDFGGDDFGDDGGDNEKPFDDEPFEAGVEADEDEDPEKYIQQLAGKLGTSLRKYNDERGEPDFDLEKYAVNSVISASHTSEMDEEDQKDIIRKVKTSGAESDVDDSAEGLGTEPEGEEGGFDEPEGEEELGFGEEELDEGVDEDGQVFYYIEYFNPWYGGGEDEYTSGVFDMGEFQKLKDDGYEVLHRETFNSREAAERYMNMENDGDEELGWELHEGLNKSEKNSKFVVNKSMKETILNKLHESAEPIEKPKVVPEVKPGIKESPIRRRVWETKPAVKPGTKMEETSGDIFDEIAIELGMTTKGFDIAVHDSGAELDRIERVYMGDTLTGPEKLSYIKDLITVR